MLIALLRPFSLGPAAGSVALAAGLVVRRQSARELRPGRDSGTEARDLFRRLVRIGQGDDVAPH